MADQDYIFELEFLVRDYECDLQGIVNNAVYMHYFEHARHRFLKATGFDFAELHTEGIDPVVSRIEINFLSPLSSNDTFVVRLNYRQKGRYRLIFDQQIFRLPDFDPIAFATVTAAFVDINRRRPVAVPRDIISGAEALRSR